MACEHFAEEDDRVQIVRYEDFHSPGCHSPRLLRQVPSAHLLRCAERGAFAFFWFLSRSVERRSPVSMPKGAKLSDSLSDDLDPTWCDN